jgi:hypothetical protein
VTNRQRLQRALRDLDRVARDDAISPTPYSHLHTAIHEAQKAAAFALDMQERDGLQAAKP